MTMNGETHQVSGYRWVMLATFCFVFFMAGMGFNAVAPLLGTIGDKWAVSFGTAALLLSVFGVAQMLMSIPVGGLAGRIGYRRPILGGAILLAIGFLLRPTAAGFGGFMAYSIIAALGWGLIWAPVSSMIAVWFPHHEIGLANGLWPVGLTAGQAFGTLTAIPFVVAYGWSATWWIYAGIAAVVALASVVLVRPRPAFSPEAGPPFRPAGLRKGISQTMNRTNWVLQYTVFATVGSITAAPVLIAPLLIGRGISPPLAGVVSGLPLVGGALGAFFVPMVAFRTKRARSMVLLSALLAAVFFYPIFLVNPGAAPWVPAALSLLFGLFVLPVMGISIGVGQLQPGVNPGNAGILTGVFLTSIGVGAAVFPALVGAVAGAAGLQSGALVEEVLIVISAVLLVLFVREPAQGPAPGAVAQPAKQ